MFNFFNNPIKRYKAKSGRIKSLYEYKLKLSEDVKLLKLEKRNLLRKITECKKNAEETNVILWDRNVLINKLNEASKCTFTVKM